MNEIDKAREAAISTFKNKYPRVIGDAPYAPQVVNAFEEGYDAGLATATAKIEALEAKLAAAKTDLNQLSSRSWLKPMTRAEFAKRSLANLQMENTDA